MCKRKGEISLQNYQNTHRARRYKAHIGILGTTQLHLRHPLIVAWWSAALPGFGHLILSKYLRGFLLFIWEIVINVNANINVAMIYSFSGQIELAKEVLDPRWMLLYIPTYLYAIWDSYRTTVDMNKVFILADRENAPIINFRLTAMGVSYLDKAKPWVSVLWSAFMPGIGHLYIHRIMSAFYILGWWIIIIYLSRVHVGVYYLFFEQISQANQVICLEWFLFLPSVYFFAIYDSYVNTVENNKLFNDEQKDFLKRRYQSPTFKLPFNPKNETGEKMHVISTFEHTTDLELVLSELEMRNIPKENILAVPLNNRTEDRKLFDSIHGSDGVSLMDLGAVLATAFAVVGASVGFRLTLGPIIWGLIGAFVGFLIGFLIDLMINKSTRKQQRKMRGKVSELILMIDCNTRDVPMVEKILWENFALGVAKMDDTFTQS